MTIITEKDKTQLSQFGITESNLNNQLEKFKKGIPPINLIDAATPGNGILRLKAEELEEKEYIFAQRSASVKIERFVPASGAASRMFKSFHQYLDDGIVNNEIKVFSEGFRSFAFYDEIKCSEDPEYSCAIHNMIATLKLSDLPKALIPFHYYESGSRTAFEEHLVESAGILGEKGEAAIHFTISEAHHEKFSKLIADKLASIEELTNCKFTISFSYQHHSTDTVAVYKNNEVYRDDAGKMLFRPGGHGSLLLNLNEIDGELIFVKNIDNVQIDHLRQTTVRYKKILGGHLLSIQEKIKNALISIDNGSADIDEIRSLAIEELSIRLPENFNGLTDIAKTIWLKKLLNRPIRICGMVKNEGEPGGGPFWTKNSEGMVSLQIVESSQMDLNNPDQAEKFKNSTHFNPVDLVCWTRDYKGEKFNLLDYSDPNTAFISEKSQQGKEIKVLEHPGLWNGAMANWTTLFVEVPIESFSPVKTINDLLRPQHQPM